MCSCVRFFVLLYYISFIIFLFFYPCCWCSRVVFMFFFSFCFFCIQFFEYWWRWINTQCCVYNIYIFCVLFVIYAIYDFDQFVVFVWIYVECSCLVCWFLCKNIKKMYISISNKNKERIYNFQSKCLVREWYIYCVILLQKTSCIYATLKWYKKMHF